MGMVKRRCARCDNEFITEQKYINRGQGNYCSQRCAAIRGKFVKCHACDADVWRAPSAIQKAKTGTFFCGPNCRSKWAEKTLVMPKAERHPNWIDGRGSYRRRAIRELGARCNNEYCEIRSAQITVVEAMLDVDHIDGNRKNHELNNLQVLCVWCHAKKTRIK